MSKIESFDDFESTDNLSDYSLIKPFPLRDKKDDDGTLEWLNANFDYLEKKAGSRIISYQRWNSLWKGIHWRSKDSYRTLDGNIGGDNTKKPKMVDNFIHELTSTAVSSLAVTNSNFTAIPWNNDVADKNNAKACQLLLKERAKTIDFDKIQREVDQHKIIFGTIFTFVKWNEDIGPKMEAFSKIEQLYKDKGGVPKQILRKLNKTNPRIGDVDVYVKTPEKVFPQDKPTWDKVDHLDEVEWVNLFELQAEYPNKADSIKENQRNHHDFGTNSLTRPANNVMVRHFYHKPTKFLPEGAYIKYTDDVILEWRDYPFTHGELPVIVERDIEITDDLWGRPRITNIEQMQAQYNNIESSQARDLGVGSAPKWMVPKGSAEFRSMNNEFSICEFKGPVAPTLVTGNPMSQHGMTKQEKLERRMTKHMRVYDTQRGEVPSGVTANSALRFLDEQASQAMEDDVRKRKSRILKTYRMMASVMGQFYREDDGRATRTLGKNNEFLIKQLGKADFTRVCDVEFQNTSALPDSKTGKIASIVDINTTTQTDPVFRRNEVVQLLDLGLDDAFVDLITASTNTAETLFEMMMEGEQVPQPEMHDDLLTYYSVMYKRIQSVGFKVGVPNEIKQQVYDYIETLEAFLSEKAKTNMMVAQELAMMNYYPSFFVLPEPLPIQGTMGTMPQPVDLTQMESMNANINEAKKSEA